MAHTADPDPAQGARAALLRDLSVHISFNWDVWGRAAAPAQRDVLSALATRAAEHTGPVNLRTYDYLTLDMLHTDAPTTSHALCVLAFAFHGCLCACTCICVHVRVCVCVEVGGRVWMLMLVVWLWYTHRAVGVQTLLDMLTDHFWLDDPHAMTSSAEGAMARARRAGARPAEQAVGVANDPHTDTPVRAKHTPPLSTHPHTHTAPVHRRDMCVYMYLPTLLPIRTRTAPVRLYNIHMCAFIHIYAQMYMY